MPSVNDFIVDFSQEQEAGGGGGVRVKPDTYHMKIVSAKTGLSENQGTPYLELTMRFLDGKHAKAKTKITERLYNSPKAMSRFRLLLEALDIKPPAKLNLVKLVPKIKGGELYVELEDDEREGYKTKSRVAFQGFINPDDYDPESAEDEEDLEDEDLEEEDEDLEDEEEDEEEDEDEEDEEEEEPPARKRRAKPKAKAKPAAKKRRRPEPEDEDDEDEEEEDEDEEEDEPPARKRRTRAKKAPAKKSRKRKDDEDDEDDDDLGDLDLDTM